MYKSHPTKYAGAMFRSRLEARWAAFFDIAGWQWDYEPLDLKGWVPDFLLHVDKGVPVLVEVKPIEWPIDSDACLEIYKTREDLAKVRSHDEAEVLVLGAYMPPIDMFGGCILGALSDGGWGPDIALLFGGTKGRLFDFAAAYGSYSYRISGEHDGDHHLIPVRQGPVNVAWREAGNRVQWRGRGA